MSRTPSNSSSRRIFRFRDPHTFDTFIQFYNEQAREFQALGVHIKIKGKSLVIEGGPSSAVAAVGEILNDLQVKAETAYKGGNAQVRSTRSSSGVRTPSSSIKKLTPKNVHQAEYIDLIKSSEIVFGLGCAGTGKTFLAVACAIQALEAGEVEKIIITRPAVEAGENLGFLPGTAEEKLDPYLTPIYDAISSLCGLAALKTWKGEGKIEIAPVAFLRGRTLSRAFVLLDEAQNCTFTQIKMLLTRIGEGSKCVITGDASQTDIGWRHSGLERMCDILESVEEIGIYEFDKSDVVRHPLVGKIIDAIDAFEQEENR